MFRVQLVRATAAAICLLLLSACAAPGGGDATTRQPQLAASGWAAASMRSANPDGGWQHQAFPGKRRTEYRPEHKQGRDAIMVRAHASASMLRQRVRIEPGELGTLRFSWLVPSLIAQADLADRNAGDAPVRLVLAFEGDRSRFSAKDAALSDLSEALTGEPLPYATLMYVWSNRRAPGTVIHNPRTSRIRKLVMETGEGRLNQWLDYEQDVRADFTRAFGEPPGALLAIGIMTDTDNTGSQAQAWYGALVHRSPRASPQTARAD